MDPRRPVSLGDVSDALTDEQIIKNLTMRGWLKKKSPAIMRGWQKRYCMTVYSSCWKFLYYESDQIESKVKGSFDLITVKDIKVKDQKVIVLEFPGRDLELKAKTAELATQWVNLLRQCKTFIPKQKRTGSMDLNPVKMENSAQLGKEKSHKIIDTQTQQIAGMQIEEINSAKQLGVVEPNFKRKESEVIASDRMMELIGLREYFKNMNNKFIESRMIFGYLDKRSKGQMKYFQKRFFLLVSAKSLVPNEYNDEQILQETQIPPWLELDTLLYFEVDNEKKPKKKGNIKMLECQEIIIKNQQKSSEKGFTFKLNMGERLYHLLTETEGERKKWSDSLGQSIRTTKEINNQLKILITRNVDPIVKLYDSETSLTVRRDKLKIKFQSDLEKIQGDDFAYWTAIQQYMLSFLEACVVKDPPRKDLVKEYIDFFHEKICECICEYWDQNYTKIDSASILKVAQWLSDYQQLLQDYFADERLINGIKVLVLIFVNRSLDSVEPVIQGILEYEKNTDPFVNENDLLVTQSPVDLFKIINEGFDMAYKMCKNKETILKQAHFCKMLIQHYQDGIGEQLEENLKVEKYIAICNNTVQLLEFTKQYRNRLLQYITEEEAEKVFDLQKVSKEFVTISNNAREKFFYLKFRDVSKHFKKFYLDLQIIEILKALITPIANLLQQLHDSFARKIWKQLLDIIVIYYFNCFIVSAGKAKKEQFDEFIEKLENDRQILLDEFDSFIFENQIKASVKPFEDMSEFIQASSVSILESCKNLRVFFGRAFTEKTINQLMHMRYDLEKDRKKELIDACRNLIEQYTKQNRDEVMENDKIKIEVLGEDEEETGTGNQKIEEIDRGVIFLMDDNEEVVEEHQQQQQEEESKKDYIEEGYIYKKKPGQIKGKSWDYRYIRIRKGIMYWYINHNSREAQNKLDILKIDDVYPHASKATKFYIQVEGGKKYKFKALNAEERDLWIKTILREQNQLENVQVQKIEAIKTGTGKKPLIKDYDEIARKERQKQKAEERQKRRIEKEIELKRKIREQQAQENKEVQVLGERTKTLAAQPLEQDAEEAQENKQTTSCWFQFLVAIGVERPPKR